MIGRPSRERTLPMMRLEEGENVSEKREAFLDKQTDWKGQCKYCKQSLVGTRAQLASHRCQEYEASLESRT